MKEAVDALHGYSQQKQRYDLCQLNFILFFNVNSNNKIWHALICVKLISIVMGAHNCFIFFKGKVTSNWL